jgi:hypothetical protein
MTRRVLMPINPTDPDARGGAMYSARGEDLKVGDLLYFLGHPHRITHFADYSPSMFPDEQWRIAYSGHEDDPHCWGMTIEPAGRYRIA